MKLCITNYFQEEVKEWLNFKKIKEEKKGREQYTWPFIQVVVSLALTWTAKLFCHMIASF